LNKPSSPKNVFQLPPGFGWSKWVDHPASSTCWMIGKSESNSKQWQLFYARLRHPSDKVKGADQNISTLHQLEDEQHIDLPSGLELKEFTAIGNDEIVFVDIYGDLFYWNPHLPTPKKLSHSQWIQDPNCTIQAGAEGWIAVAAKHKLAMWRVRRGGLHRYEEGLGTSDFDISGVELETFKATSDGRYLLALAQHRQAIVIWEFPRYVADAL